MTQMLPNSQKITLADDYLLQKDAIRIENKNCINKLAQHWKNCPFILVKNNNKEAREFRKNCLLFLE